MLTFEIRYCWQVPQLHSYLLSNRCVTQRYQFCILFINALGRPNGIKLGGHYVTFEQQAIHFFAYYSACLDMCAVSYSERFPISKEEGNREGPGYLM